MSSMQEDVVAQDAGATGSASRVVPSDLRNADLVSRLLAATPPYLYAALPLQPHAYFFSEMLRSFVQARHDSRHSQTIPQVRRAKKRGWNHAKYFANQEGGTFKPGEWQARMTDAWHDRVHPTQDEKRFEEKDKNFNFLYAKNPKIFEKPLELTTNKYHATVPDLAYPTKELSPKLEKGRKTPSLTDSGLIFQDETKIQSGSQKPVSVACDDGGASDSTPTIPPSDMLLPPPPPIWYPSMYPSTYGLDPLNFFIDLRVSGHIYDRNHSSIKDSTSLADIQVSGNLRESSPKTTEFNNKFNAASKMDYKNLTFKDNLRSHRHLSAFSVPKPKENTHSSVAINLTHPNSRFNMKYFDDIDVKNHERHAAEKNHTNSRYVMQNLTRIYQDVRNQKEGDTNGTTATQQRRGENENMVSCKNAETDADLDEGEEDAADPESARKKRRDLRALIGLELVVDYVRTGKATGSDKQVSLEAGNVSDEEIVVESNRP